MRTPRPALPYSCQGESVCLPGCVSPVLLVCPETRSEAQVTGGFTLAILYLRLPPRWQLPPCTEVRTPLAAVTVWFQQAPFELEY